MNGYAKAFLLGALLLAIAVTLWALSVRQITELQNRVKALEAMRAGFLTLPVEMQGKGAVVERFQVARSDKEITSSTMFILLQRNPLKVERSGK